LLIEPGDVGPDATSPDKPVLNPNGLPGVAQLFASPDGSRRVGDTILVFADPAAAATGLENAKASMGSEVTGAPQPIDVGSNGTMIAGNSPDNSKAVTLVMFTEGRALVNVAVRKRTRRSDCARGGAGNRPQAGRRCQERVAGLALPQATRQCRQSRSEAVGMKRNR
jgi:hypothetical protein